MADVLIENSPNTGLHSRAIRGGPFWKSTTVGYVIYANFGADLVYKKTSDGGATWVGPTVIAAAANCNALKYDCWADWQTDGDAGTKIHIAFMSDDTSEVRYIYLETATDTVAGDDVIEAAQGTGDYANNPAFSFNDLSITKTRGGNLAVGFRYLDGGSSDYWYGFYTSPDGDNWTSRNHPFEASNDSILLFPANLADNQDIWAAYLDASADLVSLKTFDDSGNSWSEAAVGACEDYLYSLMFDGQIRLSDGHLILSAWSLVDDAAADLQVWDITDAGTITAKTNIITNEAESVGVSVFINQVNDDIYVSYFSGTAWEAEVKAFYQKSVNGGTNWGGETALSANAEDDLRWVSAGCIKASLGGKFLPVWFNDDDNDLFCNTDNGITIAAAGGAALEKSLSDTVAIADTIIKGVGKNPAAEAVAIADAISKEPQIPQADSVAVADALIKDVGLVEADSLAIADSPSKAVGQPQSDTVAIADTFSRAVAYVRALADTVTIADAISKAVSKVVADAMAIADSFAKVLSAGVAHVLNLFDTVTITDSFSGLICVKTYLRAAISRMGVVRMQVSRMPLFRFICRRFQ